MNFTRHALDQMQLRAIAKSDAEAVVRDPQSQKPGREGCTNFWGIGPKSGYRIRVTVTAAGEVVTVAWADPEEIRSNMIEPMSVRVDLQAKAGYIRYSEGRIVQTIDVWSDGWVAADVDEEGTVVGIEVLGLDEETLGHARAFAKEKGLAFPANLQGVRAQI